MKTLLLPLFLIISCSNSNLGKTVTEEDILKRLSAVDPNTRLLPDNKTVVGCQYYQGCKKFIRASFSNLEIFLVEMQSEKIAHEYAVQKHAQNYGNWLFDNIQREPKVQEKIKEVINIDLTKIQPSVEKKEEENSSSSHH